jgi:DNA-binding NtrC family response regulator
LTVTLGGWQDVLVESATKKEDVMVTQGSRRHHDAPILIVHLQDTIRKLLCEFFGLEGYNAQGASSGAEALHLLQAAEGGMIVYFEPLFLRMAGNEQLHDYVMNRDEHTPHVWILVAGSMFTEEDVVRFRADSHLKQPFTYDQALASVEEAQRPWKAKHTPPTSL